VKKIKISRSKLSQPVRELRREPDGDDRQAAAREHGSGGSPAPAAGATTESAGEDAAADDAPFRGADEAAQNATPDAPPVAPPVPPHES
jgi:hypothetical protein